MRWRTPSTLPPSLPPTDAASRLPATGGRRGAIKRKPPSLRPHAPRKAKRPLASRKRRLRCVPRVPFLGLSAIVASGRTALMPAPNCNAWAAARSGATSARRRPWRRRGKRRKPVPREPSFAGCTKAPAASSAPCWDRKPTRRTGTISISTWHRVGAAPFASRRTALAALERIDRAGAGAYSGCEQPAAQAPQAEAGSHAGPSRRDGGAQSLLRSDRQTEHDGTVDRDGRADHARAEKHLRARAVAVRCDSQRHARGRHAHYREGGRAAGAGA